MTCKSTIEMKHLIFLFKNVTTWGQMLPVFSLIFKHFEISSNPFLAANTNQNEKKFASPSSVCHGLQEKAFQVNQLYNVTWFNVHSTDSKICVLWMPMPYLDLMGFHPIMLRLTEISSDSLSKKVLWWTLFKKK